jgi:uncharacterized membrane protein
MPVFKLLHILSMFAMVATQIGGEFIYVTAIGRRDVGALAAVHRTLERARLGVVSIGALVSGVVFGLLTAATGGFDFTDGWLIAAYVLVAIFIVTGGRFAGQFVRLGAAAVEAAAGRRSADEVVRDMAASRALLWFAIDLVLVVAIISDMVLKPF